MLRLWPSDREPASLRALIVPASAIDEGPASFQAAVRVCALQVFGRPPPGASPLRRGVIPEFGRVPAAVDFPKGMPLMLGRRTDDALDI